MKKILLISVFLISIFYTSNSRLVLAASSSLRQDTFDQLGAAVGSNGADLGSYTDPRVIVARVIRIGLGVIGTIFLVLTIYAGFLWMTSGGNEEQAGKARRLLYDGVIGLAIVLAAYSITYFVSRVLVDNTGTHVQNPNTADYCLQNPMAEQCQG